MYSIILRRVASLIDQIPSNWTIIDLIRHMYNSIPTNTIIVQLKYSLLDNCLIELDMC